MNKIQYHNGRSYPTISPNNFKVGERGLVIFPAGYTADLREVKLIEWTKSGEAVKLALKRSDETEYFEWIKKNDFPCLYDILNTSKSEEFNWINNLGEREVAKVSINRTEKRKPSYNQLLKCMVYMIQQERDPSDKKFNAMKSYLGTVLCPELRDAGKLYTLDDLEKVIETLLDQE